MFWAFERKTCIDAQNFLFKIASALEGQGKPQNRTSFNSI